MRHDAPYLVPMLPILTSARPFGCVLGPWKLFFPRWAVIFRDYCPNRKIRYGRDLAKTSRLSRLSSLYGVVLVDLYRQDGAVRPDYRTAGCRSREGWPPPDSSSRFGKRSRRITPCSVVRCKAGDALHFQRSFLSDCLVVRPLGKSSWRRTNRPRCRRTQ